MKRASLPEKPTKNQIDAAYPLITAVTELDADSAKELAAELYAIFILTALPPTGAGLTPKQSETMRFLQDFVDEHGHAPTLRELCDGLDEPYIANMGRMLNAIEAKGFIDRQQRAWRGVAIIKRV